MMIIKTSRKSKNKITFKNIDKISFLKFNNNIKVKIFKSDQIFEINHFRYNIFRYFCFVSDDKKHNINFFDFFEKIDIDLKSNNTSFYLLINKDKLFNLKKNQINKIQSCWTTYITIFLNLLKGIEIKYECFVHSIKVNKPFSVEKDFIKINANFSHIINHKKNNLIIYEAQQKNTILLLKSTYKDILYQEVAKIIKYRRQNAYTGMGFFIKGKSITLKKRKS